MKIFNNKRGFTLVELLVVISIISLLTSIVLSSLNDARAKARDTARIRTLQEVRTALQMYFNDKGGYPTFAFTVSNTNYTGATALKKELVDNKYISDFNITDMFYYTLENNLIAPGCINTNNGIFKLCPHYKIGTKLEKINLLNDADKAKIVANSSIDFWGNRACQTDANSTDPGGDDYCYDYATF